MDYQGTLRGWQKCLFSWWRWQNQDCIPMSKLITLSTLSIQSLCVLSHFICVPTVCDPMDCSPPGSTVHGILQAGILELVAISSSTRSSRPRNQTHICILGGFFNRWFSFAYFCYHAVCHLMQLAVFTWHYISMIHLSCWIMCITILPILPTPCRLI